MAHHLEDCKKIKKKVQKFQLENDFRLVTAAFRTRTRWSAFIFAILCSDRRFQYSANHFLQAKAFGLVTRRLSGYILRVLI